jgi:hypothetical protein
MTDYEQMTDTELQRVIAERLGWTCKTESHGSRTVHKLYTPTGRYVVQVWSQCDSPTWNLLVKYLPNWAQDSNAALELCGESHVYLGRHVTEDDTRWYATINPSFGRNFVGWAEDEHTNPHARAITIAWLRWKDAE